MSQAAFSFPDSLNQFFDSYAVLGLSVTVDDRRVLKRYRSIAKILHPDSATLNDPDQKEVANHILSRLINPAYHNLKLEKNRTEVLALLRLRAKQLSREEMYLPQGELAQQLLKIPAQEIDVFYEQAIDKLAEVQFTLLHRCESITHEIAELNLLYLHLKQGEPVVREKHTGIISSTEAKPAQFAPSTTETVQMAVHYSQRHYYRAQEYAKKGAWNQVVAELRDAIRLEATRAEYHSLLAKAYLMQNLPGMAKVHFRQALKFNPNDPLASQYAARLDLASPQATPNPVTGAKSNGAVRGNPARSGGGLFGLFAKRK